jgi:hypothetical protein
MINKNIAYAVPYLVEANQKTRNKYYCSFEEYQAEQNKILQLERDLEDKKQQRQQERENKKLQRQREAEEMLKCKQDKDKVYYLICDMFGYEIQNTKFFGEWALWNKLKSNDIIYKYLRENEEYLQQVCDKSFDTEYQRIRYFSAVLKNSLRDYQPKTEIKTEVVEPIKPVSEEHYETKYKPKTRVALLDFEEDCE